MKGFAQFRLCTAVCLRYRQTTTEGHLANISLILSKSPYIGYMATLDDLLQCKLEIENAKAQLFSQIDKLNGSLTCICVRMAEIRNVNWNAIMTNLPGETLSPIFEAGLAQTQTPYVVSQNGRWRKQERPFEILVSSVSRQWQNITLDTPQL